MVGKLLGLATGVLVGLGVVWGFNAWRDVDDYDRLSALLRECLTFVTTGENAFADQGRSIGVYDAPEFSGISDPDRHRMLYDDRVEVGLNTFGSLTSTPSRMCSVGVRTDAQARGLILENEDWIADVTRLLADHDLSDVSVAEYTSTAISYSWQDDGAPSQDILRVELIGGPMSVSGAFVSGPAN